MSQVRIVVEWVFKEMVSTFAFLDFPKNQKHLLQPIGLQFRVAALLHNAHVCLHKPQIEQFFDFSDSISEPDLNIMEQELYEGEYQAAVGFENHSLLEPSTLQSYFYN
jgi:hypothetical protein